MEAMRSAVILAGGSGSRLGTEKSLLLFFGRPLIQLTVKKLSRVVDEVIVVARNDEQAAALRRRVPDVKLACDSIQGFGPVAGLAAGMKCAKGEYVFASGCDLPFLNVLVIEMLFEFAEGYDAAVPIRPNGMKEPLHSVYKRDRMILACENAICRCTRRISAPLGELRANLVPVERLRHLDPELLTFFNVNTRDDLKTALELWQQGQGSVD